MTIAHATTIATVSNSGVGFVDLSAFNLPAGRQVVVEAVYEGGAPNIPSSVTDTAGNTYVPGTEQHDTNQGVRFFYALAPCLGNASNVIRVNFGGTPVYLAAKATVQTTSLGTTSLRAEAGGIATSAHPVTSAFNAGQCAFGLFKTLGGGSISSPDSGYSTRTDELSSTGIGIIDRYDNPGGTITAGITLPGSDDVVFAAISFTESSSGGGTETGTGALAAGASAIAGTAKRIVKSVTAAIAAAAAAIAGTAKRNEKGTGSLASQVSSAAGTAKRNEKGTSSLTAQASTAIGSAIRNEKGTGSLAAQSSAVSGSAGIAVKVVLTAAVGRELRDEHNAVVASLSGIIWKWYDGDDTSGAPVASGTFNTNASGEASFKITGSSLTAGQYGTLALFHPTDNTIRGVYRIPVT